MKNFEKEIVCPQCGEDENLELHLHTAGAYVKVPVIKKCIKPCDEILAEVITSNKVPLKYSSIDGKTRITIYNEDSDTFIYCSKCDKMIKIPKEEVL